MQTPAATSEATSRAMRSNRRTDTNPELALRRALHAQGRRFRKDHPIRAGDRNARVDVVFTRARLAVFIDGCFWHMCPDHCRMPTANRKYWEYKLGGNAQRDLEITGALRADGWTVLRIWEHVPLSEAVAQVEAAL